MIGYTRHSTEPLVIQKRRMEADRLADAQRVAHQNLQEKEDQKLEARRAKLAAMFAAEDEQYKKEIAVAVVESSKDRARRMVVHARERKAEREKQRSAFADQQMKAQWREACDDLRNIGSQIAAKNCAAEVQSQRVDNDRRRKLRAEEDARYDALWEAQRQLKNKMADEEERKKQLFNEHMKSALTEQVNEARQRKADEQRRTEEEKLAFQQRLEKEESIARQMAAEEAERKKKEKQQFASENAEYLAKRRANKAAEREAERKHIEELLRAHRQETHQKLIDKRQMRIEQQEYREFLRLRREEERRLESELDRITQAALDRDNQKRDMATLKEELARAELMKQVEQARFDQLQDKKGAAARGAKELAMEKTLMERELDLWKRRKAHEESEDRAKRMQRKQDLEKQVDVNQARRDIVFATAGQEFLDSKRAEAEYAAFIANERADPAKLVKKQNFQRRKDGWAFGMYS